MTEADFTRRLHLEAHQRRDEIAAQEKEHRDAETARDRKKRDAAVRKKHDEKRDGAKSIERRNLERLGRAPDLGSTIFDPRLRRSRPGAPNIHDLRRIHPPATYHERSRAQ